MWHFGKFRAKTSNRTVVDYAVCSSFQAVTAHFLYVITEIIIAQ